jgi:hypothetical protein
MIDLLEAGVVCKGDAGLLNSHVVCARTSQGDVGVSCSEIKEEVSVGRRGTFAEGNTHVAMAFSLQAMTSTPTGTYAG